MRTLRESIDLAQDFVVDLDVEVEVGADELSATADYRELIRTARSAVLTQLAAARAAFAP